MTMQNLKMNSKKDYYNRVLRLIKFIDKLPKGSVCSIMGKQTLRSDTSILANIIGANSASSKKDFINFFTRSLKSANESKVWLAPLRDTNKGDQKELKRLLDELLEIANIIAPSIINTKRQEMIFYF